MYKEQFFELLNLEEATDKEVDIEFEPKSPAINYDGLRRQEVKKKSPREMFDIDL